MGFDVGIECALAAVLQHQNFALLVLYDVVELDNISAVALLQQYFLSTQVPLQFLSHFLVLVLRVHLINVDELDSHLPLVSNVESLVDRPEGSLA